MGDRSEHWAPNPKVRQPGALANSVLNLPVGTIKVLHWPSQLKIHLLI